MRLAVLFLLVPCLDAAEPYAVAPESQSHWAWKTVGVIEIPRPQKAVWARSPIDCFILSRLDASHVEPAAPASREQLLRRVSIDLIGLPPTPADIDEFVADASPDAWEKLIDRLIASPHYGERWGRHWLDLARYADSNGYEYDEIRPDAWRYRDYVIEAFNSDKPYTQFIREQLAGDEIDPESPSALIATGFNLLGPDMTDSSDQIRRRQNSLNDMVDTAGLAFLGLTIGCARCHDHKFEPFSQVEYYRLQAFFTPAKFRNDINIVPLQQRAELAKSVLEYQAQRSPIKGALDELELPLKTKLRAAKLALQSEEVRAAHETPEEKRTPAERERVAETIRFVTVSQTELLKEMNDEEKARHKELSSLLKTVESSKPHVPVAIGLQDSNKPERTFLLEMGEPSNKGAEVHPGFLAALTTEAPNISPRPDSTTGRRTALANWLADERHPLTARVMVNRIWHHHFGSGIVRTPSDFGLRGQPPTHPELLDWLADDFMRCGWGVKRVHRSMLASATYQQSTSASPKSMALDPDNQLYSRMNRRRIEGEIVRDSLLAISGRLWHKQGGPGISIPTTSADKGARAATVTSDSAEYLRRSVYLVARRNLRNPFLEVFDLPDSNLSCSRRECSTTAPQALALLNDSDVVEAAKSMAARIENEPNRVIAAFRLVLGRKPTETESQYARIMLNDSPLSELCRALFNVNEFVYVD